MYARFDREHGKYSSAHRVEMDEVLDNWKLRGGEGKYKVLDDYLCDVQTNSSFYDSAEDLRTELRILNRIDDVLCADSSESLAVYRNGEIELYRALKNSSEVRIMMLEFCKSRMKAATILDFLKFLADLPDEFSASPIKDATTLNFLKILVDLDLPEECKNWLLHKVVENDFNTVFEEYKDSVKYYIKKLQRLGVQCQENNLTEDEYPCTNPDYTKQDKEIIFPENYILGIIFLGIAFPSHEPNTLLR